jgi:D-proline reductase (dithiol) PrdB
MHMKPDDRPIRYMERTRRYYRALGYEKAYEWAKFEDVPFSRLDKPLGRTRVALITTASPPKLENRDASGRRHVWSGDVLAPPALFTGNLAWDKESTHTDDRETYLPIEVAMELASGGTFAGLAARFHGVPTEYSQRKTLTEDAPQVLSRLREDGAEAALLCAL